MLVALRTGQTLHGVLVVTGDSAIPEDLRGAAGGGVGLAHWAGHADADAVLRDADAAIYAAKAAGKGRLAVARAHRSGAEDGADVRRVPRAQPATA